MPHSIRRVPVLSLVVAGALCFGCADDDVGPVDANLGSGGAPLQTRTGSTNTWTNSGGAFAQPTTTSARTTGGAGNPAAGGVTFAEPKKTGGASGVRASGGATPLSGEGGAPSGGASTIPNTSATCSTALVGRACAATDQCSWNDTSNCVQGSCSCSNGLWACQSARSLSCGTCPIPQQAACGTSCPALAAGCLCTCGGGDNFTSCACQSGTWTCLSCAMGGK